MTWWSNQEVDPKRKNRFKVYIDSNFLVTAVSVTKPAVSIETKEYQMVNQMYSYPGLAKWDPISISFVDGNGANNTTDEYDTSKKLWELLTSSGYSSPGGAGSPEKSKMVRASMGNDLRIVQVTPNGKEVEEWTLHNPIITKLSWGELDYGDDGFVSYTMDIKYDWATLD